jgi:hypothetical protein
MYIYVCKTDTLCRLLAPFSVLFHSPGVCAVLNRGWWNYEWCHRTGVRQFHIDHPSGVQKPTWSLGSQLLDRGAVERTLPTGPNSGMALARMRRGYYEAQYFVHSLLFSQHFTSLLTSFATGSTVTRRAKGALRRCSFTAAPDRTAKVRVCISDLYEAEQVLRNPSPPARPSIHPRLQAPR